MENVKKFSPGVFGLAIFCFLLPFVSLSSEGQKIATFTGAQLVEKGGGPIGIIALIALASGVFGFGFSFLRSKKSAIVPAILGGVGLVTLLVLQSISLAGVHFIVEIGYWLTALLYVSAVGLNGFIFSKSKEDKIKKEGTS